MGASAIVGGIGAAGGMATSLFGASSMSDAYDNAAQAQLQAAREAQQLQWKMYSQSRNDMMPWLRAGSGAVNRLSAGLKPGGEYSKFTLKDFEQDPGYQWRKQEGINTLRAGGAATGMLGSGNMGTALVGYGQNLASNEYQNAYSRWMDSYNKVANLAGAGQSAAQSTGNAALSTGQGMASTALYGGNAQAQGILGSANAWNQGLMNSWNQLMGGVGAMTGGSGFGGGGNGMSGMFGQGSYLGGLTQGSGGGLVGPSGYDIGGYSYGGAY